VTWSRGERQVGFLLLALQPEGVALTYRYRVGSGDWESVRQAVTLDWTPCHYGGTRPWLRCAGCRRRVSVLCGEGKWFLCHHCYELPYGSQQETAEDRHCRKVRKIRDRLEASHNLAEPVWPWNKPKGMHWSTWERLRVQEEQAHRLGLEDLEGALERLRRHEGMCLGGRSRTFARRLRVGLRHGRRRRPWQRGSQLMVGQCTNRWRFMCRRRAGHHRSGAGVLHGHCNA
jgi:hypothetical protein